jgi:hypothetical protein
LFPVCCEKNDKNGKTIIKIKSKDHGAKAEFFAIIVNFTKKYF